MTAVTSSTRGAAEPTSPAAAYVAAVAAALAGVADPERQDLLDDLADHLAELEAEDGDSLEARLGPPELYAAELLASAGIDVGAAEPAGPRPPWWRRLRAAIRTQLAGPRADAVRSFLPELRPGWWVLRAWAVLALLTVWLADDRRMFPIADVFQNVFVSALALLAAIVVSVQLGRGGGRWLDRGVTGLGVVGMLVALGQGSPDVEYSSDSVYGYGDTYQGYLLSPDGRVITNIWPFDQDGQPLEGVFLFDQDGLPIDVGEVWDVRPGTVLVPGLYPQPQPMSEYDPVTGGSREVPATPPVVSIPRLPVASSTTTTVPAATTTTVAVAPPSG